MSFTGQFNFGYPITSQNIITNVPNNAVLPLTVGSAGTPAGAITTETITPNRTWTVRINGANYKIPLLAI